MPHDEGLLFGVEPRQHLAQAACAGDAGQYGGDVPFVVEQGGDARPNLAHHLFINAGGSLVYHQQGDVVLSQFAGDDAEDGLPRHLRVEEFVRLFDDNQQGGRFGGLVAQRFFHPFHVHLVDAAGEVVGNQDVSFQGVAVPPELQHHRDALFNVFQNGFGAVAVAGVPDEVEAGQPFQPPAEGVQAGADDVAPFHQGVYVVFVRFQQLLDPPLAPKTMQGVRRANHRIAQIQGGFEHFQVFRADVLPAHGDDVIGLYLPAPAAFLIQGENGNLRGKELLQPLDRFAGFGLNLPAVIVVHVEDEADGGAVLYHAR